MLNHKPTNQTEESWSEMYKACNLTLEVYPHNSLRSFYWSLLEWRNKFMQPPYSLCSTYLSRCARRSLCFVRNRLHERRFLITNSRLISLTVNYHSSKQLHWIASIAVTQLYFHMFFYTMTDLTLALILCNNFLFELKMALRWSLLYLFIILLSERTIGIIENGMKPPPTCSNWLGEPIFTKHLYNKKCSFLRCYFVLVVFLIIYNG